MSIHYFSAVWKIKMQNSGRKLVALALADMANDEGFAWPSMKSLENRCDMGETTIRDHIAHLQAIGLVTKTERFSNNRQTSNMYRMMSLQELQGIANRDDEERKLGEGPKSEGSEIRGGRVQISEGGGSEKQYPENHHEEPSLIPHKEVVAQRNGKSRSRAEETRVECEEACKVVVPQSLHTEEFLGWWAKWCSHRTRMAQRGKVDGKKQAWTVGAANRALKKCVAMGVRRACDAMDNSISKEYFDLVEDQAASLFDAPSQGGWTHTS